VIVVIDSGVWVSAMQYGGTPRGAVTRILKTDEIAICKEIEDEVTDVLQRKFSQAPEAISERLRPLLQDCIWVQVTGQVSGICRDPKDDCILECALKAGAQLIVTGDKDLLTLGEFRSIRIITARQYLDLPIAD
jgi:putative PIN family toxin of toxin-antitoxin system